jgi:hypothetical protein
MEVRRALPRTRRCFDHACTVEWYRIILDEAHTIRNRTTQNAKAAYSLRGKRRWALTVRTPLFASPWTHSLAGHAHRQVRSSSPVALTGYMRTHAVASRTCNHSCTTSGSSRGARSASIAPSSRYRSRRATARCVAGSCTVSACSHLRTGHRNCAGHPRELSYAVDHSTSSGCIERAQCYAARRR